MRKLKVSAPYPNLASSKAMKFIADNLNKTTKKGGNVSVVTGGRGNFLSVNFLIKDGAAFEGFPNEADEKHRFSGSFNNKHKFIKAWGDGVGAPSKKTISDEEALEKVKAIFELASKY